MIIAWGEAAWADYVYWQGQDKKILKRINELIKDIQRNGTKGLGKAEPLKYVTGGWHSRRIDKCHRLVFRIKENRLEILQCKEHYSG